MPRRAERALLVTALGIGLVGGALVVVAAGATLEAGPAAHPELTFPKLVGVWLQLAAAGLLCHAVLAFRRPHSDQLLLPVSLALTGIGLAVVFSLDPAAAQKQVTWVQLALAVFLLTVLNGRRIDELRDYRYLAGLFTVLLLLIPMALGQEINGARLWVRFGSFTMQPGELAKVTLVVFLASYLHSRGAVSYTHLDVYKRQDHRGLDPTGGLRLLGDPLQRRHGGLGLGVRRKHHCQRQPEADAQRQRVSILHDQVSPYPSVSGPPAPRLVVSRTV